jgi:uncharacterized protein
VSFRRSLIVLGGAALACSGAELLGAELVTSAIAHAPNAPSGLTVPGSPPRPAPSDAQDLVVQVGPPAASLDVWVIDPPAQAPARGTLLLLHGIRMDKSSLLGFGRRFSNAGYRSVLVDLRGHGASTGTYLTYGVVESRDLVQLVDVLQNRFHETAFAIFGYSYGGAVAIQSAALDPRIKAVVAVSAFASLRQVVNDYKQNFFPVLDPIVPANWLQARLDEAAERAQFDPAQADPERAAAALAAPLLLLHGSADTQVPPWHAEELKKKARDASLVLLEGETHASMLQSGSAQVEALTLAFLERSGFATR